MIYTVSIGQLDDLAEFRGIARRLLAAGIAPADVAWTSGPTQTLFTEPLPAGERIAVVPRAFAELASAVICHREERRWSLLYQALWRIDRGERHLMDQAADPLTHQLRRMAATVRHDQHRMTAFIRFREVTDADGSRFVAWYEPRHHTLRRTSTFFIDRFTNMRFSILTPDLTLHWDGTKEYFAPGLQRGDAASGDAVEDWWQQYYAAIFNPARINTKLMQAHMPRHFWRDLPEARVIMELIEQAGTRTDRMIKPTSPSHAPEPLSTNHTPEASTPHAPQARSATNPAQAGTVSASPLLRAKPSYQAASFG